MIADASFTSTGLNYFHTVVPAVIHFNQTFIDTGRIESLEQWQKIAVPELKTVWKNSRSWRVALGIASSLSSIKHSQHLDDRSAFRLWASQASLDQWQRDPLGNIPGVGINTFQYLRMMGGIDTVMPDKIVKKIMREIHVQSGMSMPEDDAGFILYMERLGQQTGYRAIELCWMTWLVRSEASLMKTSKFSAILGNI